jgi:hypothetical protein
LSISQRNASSSVAIPEANAAFTRATGSGAATLNDRACFDGGRERLAWLDQTVHEAHFTGFTGLDRADRGKHALRLSGADARW